MDKSIADLATKGNQAPLSGVAKQKNSAQRRREIWIKTRLREDLLRPGQAPIGDPYWIVVNSSPHKGSKATRMDRPRFYFRHPSLEGAKSEANRLAHLKPGKMFVVFERLASFHVDLAMTE